ncbi:hypothetical protein L345_10430, partial [Ophiophagus hannah]
AGSVAAGPWPAPTPPQPLLSLPLAGGERPASQPCPLRRSGWLWFAPVTKTAAWRPTISSANVVSASDRLVPGLTSSCQDLPQTSPTFTISKRHTIRCTVTCLGKTKNCIPAEGPFKIPLSALFRGVFVLLCIRNNWLLDSGQVLVFPGLNSRCFTL